MAVGKRAWGSAKQKAALERARLISARKRRGTGKVELKKPGRFKEALDKRRVELKAASKTDPTVSQKKSYSPKSAWNKSSMKARADMVKQPYGGNAASRIPRNDGVSRPGTWRRKPKTQGGSNSRDANLKRYSDANRRIDEKLAALKKSSAKKPDNRTDIRSTTSGSNTVKAKNGQTVKVGDAVNIGTGGQVWRITGIDGDTVTARGLLQLNANSKVERKFKASQISERRDEDRFKESPKANAPKASGRKSPISSKDPSEMGVSQILAERKHLIAKQNSEGLTKEEEARLKAIRAESALRHQNRKAGKGTGPTKVSLAKSTNAPKAQPKSDATKNFDAGSDGAWAAKTYGGDPNAYWNDPVTGNLTNGNPKDNPYIKIAGKINEFVGHDLKVKMSSERRNKSNPLSKPITIMTVEGAGVNEGTLSRDLKDYLATHGFNSRTFGPGYHVFELSMVPRDSKRQETIHSQIVNRRKGK